MKIRPPGQEALTRDHANREKPCITPYSPDEPRPYRDYCPEEAGDRYVLNARRVSGTDRRLGPRAGANLAMRYGCPMASMDQAQYERLLRFRTGLRRFLRWSAEQAAGAGLTPAQHQLLLAIRGHPDPLGPTIGDVARYLFLRHHSTVELVDRAQTAGLLERHTDPDDSRAVRLRLTERGEERLRTLTDAHMEELARLESELHALWDGLDTTVHTAAPPDGPP
jgi:DNA-binding MarR family transcriptional regulator